MKRIVVIFMAIFCTSFETVSAEGYDIASAMEDYINCSLAQMNDAISTANIQSENLHEFVTSSVEACDGTLNLHAMQLKQNGSSEEDIILTKDFLRSEAIFLLEHRIVSAMAGMK